MRETLIYSQSVRTAGDNLHLELASELEEGLLETSICGQLGAQRPWACVWCVKCVHVGGRSLVGQNH